MSGPILAALALGCAVLLWPSAPSRDRLAVRPSRRGGSADRASGWLGSATPDRAPRLPARLSGLVSRSAAGPVAVEQEVVDLVEGLSAALRAGLTPPRAFDQLSRSAVVGRDSRAAPAVLDGLLSQLAAQSAVGARLEPVLRDTAHRLGSPALLAVAAGWAMAERHGAPVVDVLDRLGAGLRDAARSAAAVEAALAAPRATAALLGVLPLGGVVLGELVGVDPLGVLVGTPLGRFALIGGLALTWGGRVWMRRLVAAVERG